MTTVQWRKATENDLQRLWQDNIDANPDDPRWPRWRAEYMAYNADGWAATFAVAVNGVPVGEGTLLFDARCGAIAGREMLCDGKTVCNLNALRIQKPYEGRGYISTLVRHMEAYAAALGYRVMTVGVEACEMRNRAIYAHLGFTRPVLCTWEDGAQVLYFAKDLSQDAHPAGCTQGRPGWKL